MPIGIPTICWYAMPSNCTFIFSTRKVKASHNSVQFQYVYEPYFLLEKIPVLSDVQKYVYDSVETPFNKIQHFCFDKIM